MPPGSPAGTEPARTNGTATVPVPPRRGVRRSTGLGLGGRGQPLVLLIVLAVLSITMSFVSSNFYSSFNLAAIALETSFVALVALAQMTVLIGGGIDLSVGATAGFSGIVSAYLATSSGLDPWLAVLLGVGMGLIIGLVNGALVAVVGLNPFISTLSVQFVLGGLVLVTTQGVPVVGVPASVGILGAGQVAGVPVPAVIVVIAAVALAFWLRRTYWGRHVYALGGNEEAALLAGVKVVQLKVTLYMIAGGLSALAGVLQVTRLGSGQPTIGDSWMLPSFAAPILGGTGLTGGTGSVIGTLLGALVMGVLQNGVVISGISLYWQNVVVGTVLILAIVVDRWRDTGGRPSWLPALRRSPAASPTDSAASPAESRAERKR